MNKYNPIIIIVIIIIIVFIVMKIVSPSLNNSEPIVYENIYPEFQKYQNFTSLNLYKSIGFEEDEREEIKIDENLKMELFKILKNKLQLKGSGRFNSTNHYIVIINFTDNITFKFDILIENYKRAMIFLNNHEYIANDILNWFIINILPQDDENIFFKF